MTIPPVKKFITATPVSATLTFFSGKMLAALLIIINLKAAKQIGLTIPPNVLVRADKVIR